MTKFKSILANDIIHVDGRFWKVSSCLYGALGHEDMIGIECMDRNPGCDGERNVKEMLVPLALIPQTSIFRAVDHDAEAKPKLAAVS